MSLYEAQHALDSITETCPCLEYWKKVRPQQAKAARRVYTRSVFVGDFDAMATASVSARPMNAPIKGTDKNYCWRMKCFTGLVDMKSGSNEAPVH